LQNIQALFAILLAMSCLSPIRFIFAGFLCCFLDAYRCLKIAPDSSLEKSFSIKGQGRFLKVNSETIFCPKTQAIQN